MILIMEGNIKIYIQLRKEELNGGFRSIKSLNFLTTVPLQSDL